MEGQRLCYYYKVSGLTSSKQVEKEVEKLSGVVSCKIDGDTLVYELEGWVNEYDILTSAMEICENQGGELIVGEDNIYREENDEIEQDIELQDVANIDDNRPISTDNEEKVSDFKENSEENETLRVKRKKFKTDIIVRSCELLVSLVLMIIALAVKGGNTQARIGFDSVLFILSFAVSIYEVFYFSFIAISKKQFYHTDITVSLATIALVLFGFLKHSVIIAFVYSVAKAVEVFSARYRELALADILDVEIGDEKQAFKKAKKDIEEMEIAFQKGKKLQVILGYLSLALVIIALVALIPALKIGSYAEYIVSIALTLSVLSVFFSGKISNDCYINTIIKAKYYEIECGSVAEIDKSALCNQLEMDVSAMLNDGKLKEDAIGAFLEMKLLGVKNFVTNFDVAVDDSVKEQVDFVDNPVQKPSVITVGNSGKDVNFGKGGIEIESGEMFRIPLWLRISKRCFKSKRFTQVMMLLSAITLAITLLLPVMGKIAFAISGGILSIAFMWLANLFATKNHMK